MVHMIEKFAAEALRGKSQATIKTYTHALKQFAEWLERSGADLESFARSDIKQYIYYLTVNKKSSATILKVFNAIKAYCKWNKRTEAIKNIRVVKQQDLRQLSVPRILSLQERNRLIREVKGMNNKRDIAIVTMLLNTGLRLSELVYLDIDDIYIDRSECRGTLTVTKDKINKERTIPLNAETRLALFEYLEERNSAHKALFLSSRGERISVRSVQLLVNRYGFTVQQLRHTFITDLVRSGLDISVIKSLSGHSSADMILRYSVLTEEEDKINAVEQLYKGEKGE